MFQNIQGTDADPQRKPCFLGSDDHCQASQNSSSPGLGDGSYQQVCFPPHGFLYVGELFGLTLVYTPSQPATVAGTVTESTEDSSVRAF